MLNKIFGKSIALIFALLIGSMAIANTASAAEIDCTLTGYTFMGGGSAKTSDSSNDDYLLAQPLTYMYAGTDMWGYAWIKFDDIGTETVEEAYLILDLLGVGGMYIEDASESYPGILDIYSPDDIDVAELADDSDLRSTLHDYLLASTALVEGFTMTSNGSYAIDITDIYNAWVTGDLANNGLVLVSASGNSQEDIQLGAVGTKYASISGDLGTAPYIATTAVPVPPALLLMGSGLVGLISLRRRKTN